MPCTWSVTRFLIIALAAIFVSALFDARLAYFSRARGIDAYLLANDFFRESLKAPGEFWFTLLVAVVAGFVHRDRWRAGLFVLLGTSVAIINIMLKWVVGRTRPFRLTEGSAIAEPFVLDPFRGGITGFFHQRNLCFPSGHVAVAFATGAALAILWPRCRWLFFALASVVAIERTLENSHWFSDTVAAAALGIGGVRLIGWIWRRKRAA